MCLYVSTKKAPPKRARVFYKTVWESRYPSVRNGEPYLPGRVVKAIKQKSRAKKIINGGAIHVFTKKPVLQHGSTKVVIRVLCRPEDFIAWGRTGSGKITQAAYYRVTVLD